MNPVSHFFLQLKLHLILDLYYILSVAFFNFHLYCWGAFPPAMKDNWPHFIMNDVHFDIFWRLGI